MTKIAIVTGGSRGLGRNAAENLAARGIDVVLTYKSNQDEAEKVVKSIVAKGRKAKAMALDVSKSKSFSGFAEDLQKVLKDHWGKDRFDFLINNAGIGTWALLKDTSEEQFDELVNIHFKGPYFLTQKLLPLINDNGGIVNVSTGLARFALPGYSAYASMKGAMEVLTRYMAKELGPRGIRVNIVAPGAIETDFSGGAVRDNAEMNKHIASQTALGRTGLPDDIGPLIAIMCLDETRWVNAQRIEASGGMFL
ncbi:MAG: SDR family oxidoreductase [Proteobacteria bacterium]|nr:MAG: SDR family oxidoreductase [Pseudomonadota bacterium]